jgi:HAE1 family hydrophobic/amphiphilic exporter-1
MAENLSLIGMVAANNDVAVLSETQGRITAVLANVGDEKRAGAVLIHVDDELKQANLASAEVSYQKAKKDLDRFETLHQEGIVPDAQLEAVRQIPGVKVRINPIGIFGMANQTPIQLVVSGTNRAEVQKAADRVVEIVRTIPGTADVRLSSEEGKPETRVEIDRQKMAAFGLSLAEVGATLRVALSGDDDSKYRDGDDEYPIRIVLDEFDRSGQADLGALAFVNRRGEQIELKQFAAIYQTTGPTKLERSDRNESITVMSQAVGRPSGSIGQDIRAALAKETLPKGVEIAYEADLKNQAESFISLGIALLAAILFVYMIMVALYDSYIYPFVVLFSVPVAIVGALLALALTMKSLSIFSILGMIMLVGLVSKNAILLVDRTNQKRAEGLSASEALLEAGQTRLRPILMTTLAMVIGMLPIALGSGAGSEWKTGLAWALVGGLSSSMLLTLVLVPVIYLTIDRWRTALPALIKRVFQRRPAIKGVPQPAVTEEWSRK